PQGWRVAALFLGDAVPKQPGAAAIPAGLADALDAVRQLGLALAVAPTVSAGARPAPHPGRRAGRGGRGPGAGRAGVQAASRAAALNRPRVVARVELDLDALIELGATEIAATPIGTLPAAPQDLSLVVKAGTPAADVLAAVTEGAGELLEHARLVDDYRGSG